MMASKKRFLRDNEPVKFINVEMVKKPGTRSAIK